MQLHIIKDGQKGDVLNLSNARRKTYAQLQQMTDAQKKGVIVCEDYPVEDFEPIPSEMVTYGEGTVDEALDDLNNPEFTEASTRANIASGESISTIFGKIKKWFTDLKTVAFTGAYSDLSGTPDLTNVAYKNINNKFSASQSVDQQNGTTTTVGESYFVIGNNIAQGNDKNSAAVLRLYGSGSSYADLQARNVTANRSFQLPDKSGTIALTSDLTPISLASATSEYGTIAVSDIKQMGNLVVGNIRIAVTQGATSLINVATVPINVGGLAHVPVTAVYGSIVFSADLTGNVIRLFASSGNPLPAGGVLELHFTVFI